MSAEGHVQLITCDHCGDVIGVYEPMVVMVDASAHETSRAADPQLSLGGLERYHRACFLERSGHLPGPGGAGGPGIGS